MRVADTSFLYALFSRSDAFHDRALRAAARAEPIIIPPEIFGETAALIHHRQGFQAAREAGDWIRRQGHIEIGLPSRDMLEEAWREFLSASGQLSYPDSVVVAWCRARGMSALAFDTRILARVRL